ncbi:hypothetical protein BLSTO_06159, partial [Blastocystis sp. subtype 1]
MKDLNKQIDDVFETIYVSEAILRIKEITGRQLPETLLKRQEMPIPPAMIGRIVGKNAATLHGLEEQFKVHIGSRREGVYVISGEEANVVACGQEMSDMLEETQTEVPLQEAQFFALMDHQARYLHQVEESCHVHLRIAKDKVTVRGGKRAVARAERALVDLFRKTTTVEITPFAKTLLVANKMQRFGELRAACPAYLRLGEGLKSIEVLGTAADQRESAATVREFVATHVEVSEERAAGEDLLN